MAVFDFPTDLALFARPTDMEEAATMLEAYVTAGGTVACVPGDLRIDAQFIRDAIQDPLNWASQPGREKIYFDARCSGTGYYPLSNDTDNPADTQLIRCVSCDGWGYTHAQVTPKARYYE